MLTISPLLSATWKRTTLWALLKKTGMQSSLYALICIVIFEIWQIKITSANYGPVLAQEHCRINPPRFLAECCKRQLNQGSFVCCILGSLLFLICIEFVSISQVIGCEDRLQNDLYCVEWGVKLYSNQPTVHWYSNSKLVYSMHSVTVFVDVLHSIAFNCVIVVYFD